MPTLTAMEDFKIAIGRVATSNSRHDYAAFVAGILAAIAPPGHLMDRAQQE